MWFGEVELEKFGGNSLYMSYFKNKPSITFPSKVEFKIDKVTLIKLHNFILYDKYHAVII